MSIYGQSLMSRNNEIVTEGLLFLSNDAKSLKKEIQEKLKSEYTKGFINKIKNNVSSTSDFDKTKAQSALNFVMEDALGGGVTRSLAVDMHGKTLGSALLEMEID